MTNTKTPDLWMCHEILVLCHNSDVTWFAVTPLLFCQTHSHPTASVLAVRR